MTDAIKIATEQVSALLTEAQKVLKQAQVNEENAKRAFETATAESQRAQDVVQRLQKALGGLSLGQESTSRVSNKNLSLCVPVLPKFSEQIVKEYGNVSEEIIYIVDALAKTASQGGGRSWDLNPPGVSNEKTKEILERMYEMGIIRTRATERSYFESVLVPLAVYRQPEGFEISIIDYMDKSIMPMKISSLHSIARDNGISKDASRELISRMIVDGLITRKNPFDGNSEYMLPVRDWRAAFAELPLASRQVVSDPNPR